eukprot:1196632-Amphidinium_carterae.1
MMTRGRLALESSPAKHSTKRNFQMSGKMAPKHQSRCRRLCAGYGRSLAPSAIPNIQLHMYARWNHHVPTEAT